MTSEGTIEHDGIVQRSDLQSVTVKIASASACSGCHAGDNCSVSKTEEKSIDISGRYDVHPGDRVKVMMKRSTGYSAVLLGYIAPLILVVALLVIFTSFQVKEVVAGAASIVILLPYYLLLFAFRKRLSKKFTFSIKV